MNPKCQTSNSHTNEYCYVAVRIRPTKESVWKVNETQEMLEYDDKRYFFDSVFQGSDNKYLYDKAVKKSIGAVMEGVNSIVFAYGQTNSGKTYSMMGEGDQPGIIPQAIDEVFRIIKETKGDYLLRMSYLEIYNDAIRDLLCTEQKDLRILDHSLRGVHIPLLKEEVVTSAIQLMSLISKGEANRSVFSTENNQTSSRAHTIFQLTIERKHLDAVYVSKLNLIDLAGSEKATRDSSRRKEGGYINKSLLTLGIVIGKLADNHSGHIPFRESKLTRFLKPCLCGNSRITLIATITPDLDFLDETLNTLKFASRVSRIHPKPEQNLVLDEKALIKRYQEEIKTLKEKLQKGEENIVQNVTDQTQIKEYEDKLEHARMARTILIGRIDYLTRLIVSSATVDSNPLIKWDTKKEPLGIQSGIIASACKSEPNLSHKQSVTGADENQLQKVTSTDQDHQKLVSKMHKAMKILRYVKLTTTDTFVLQKIREFERYGAESVSDIFNTLPPEPLETDVQELKQQIVEFEIVAEEQVREIEYLKQQIQILLDIADKTSKESESNIKQLAEKNKVLEDRIAKLVEKTTTFKTRTENTKEEGQISLRNEIIKKSKTRNQKQNISEMIESLEIMSSNPNYDYGTKLEIKTAPKLLEKTRPRITKNSPKSPLTPNFQDMEAELEALESKIF